MSDNRELVLLPNHILTLRKKDWTPETCDHGVTFDWEAARGLRSAEVRKRWPRGWFDSEHPCPLGCGYIGIAYASYTHYIHGDW